MRYLIAFTIVLGVAACGDDSTVGSEPPAPDGSADSAPTAEASHESDASGALPAVCVGRELRRCDDAGACTLIATCPFVCLNGACAGVCQPGSCPDAGQAEVCSDAGVWVADDAACR